MANDIYSKLLPAGRSLAYNKEIQIGLKSRLREKGVRFNIVCFQGSEFLVWEAKDSEIIDSLVKEIVRNTEAVSSDTLRCT